MGRTPSCSVWNRLPALALLIAGAALLTVSAPARAGLGDMMKKAKDKALKTAGQKVSDEAPPDSCQKVEFDAVVAELTDERIERILATFKAAGEAGAGRPPLVEKLNHANDERGALMEKHAEAIQADRAKRSDIETCHHDGYQAATERRAEEYRSRALTDPALMAKFAKLAQENNERIMKGDSAALAKTNAAMIEEYLPTREDSLKVRKDCGPIPPKSAAEQRLEALDKQITALNDSIAKIDGRVAKAQSKQGGMDQQQWAMALERIQMYLSWRKNNSPAKSRACGFSEAEIAAMEKRLEQLRGALGS
jgi:hypothetical protein